MHRHSVQINGRLVCIEIKTQRHAGKVVPYTVLTRKCNASTTWPLALLTVGDKQLCPNRVGWLTEVEFGVFHRLTTVQGGFYTLHNILEPHGVYNTRSMASIESIQWKLEIIVSWTHKMSCERRGNVEDQALVLRILVRKTFGLSCNSQWTLSNIPSTSRTTPITNPTYVLLSLLNFRCYIHTRCLVVWFTPCHSTRTCDWCLFLYIERKTYLNYSARSFHNTSTTPIRVSASRYEGQRRLSAPFYILCCRCVQNLSFAWYQRRRAWRERHDGQ